MNIIDNGLMFRIFIEADVLLIKVRINGMNLIFQPLSPF